MSIQETVGRYEGPVRTNNSQRINLQARRIAERVLERKIKKLNEEFDVNEKAKWAERLEEKVGYKRATYAIKQCNAEVKQGAIAAIMVRRRALEVQMQREMEQYNTELATQGKTFHTQRI
ncbi:uncharacterized protein [Littorina saxatilis]|uniref:Uncharacterized protein n=1 Tax=Littorina saxatilis TaxID=31220 RepID=A0AAN9GQ23_9CAEN